MLAEAIGTAMMSETDADGAFMDLPRGIVAWREDFVYWPENGEYAWKATKQVWPIA